MFDTIYGINLTGFNGEYKIADSGPSYGFAASGAGPYSDIFRRDKSPTVAELFSNLVSIAYRCAKANADMVANTRLRLYVKNEQGQPKAKFIEGWEMLGKRVSCRVPRERIKHMEWSRMRKSALLDAVDRGDDVEEVTSHNILGVLEEPEDAYEDGGLAAYAHRQATVMQLETCGRAYWYVQEWQRVPGAGKIPKRVILLRAPLVIEKPDMSGKNYISGYQYGTTTLDTEDVIRFTYPDPANPHFGVLSPMRAAIMEIRQMRGGDAFTEALLQNGGYPTAILSPADSESVIGDAEAARIASNWRGATAMHNAGKLMILKTANVKLQATAFKPAEIIDIEKAREIAGRICDIFDVPRTKIFRDSSNLASSDSGDEAHARDAGIPRCALVESTLNSQFVPLFDDSKRLLLAFDSPVPEDRAYLLEQAAKQVQAGFDTVDGARSLVGLEKLGGEVGDCLVLPRGAILINPKTGDVVDTGGAAAEPDTGTGGKPGDGQNAPQNGGTPKPDGGGGKKKPKKSIELEVLDKMSQVVTQLAGIMEKQNAVPIAARVGEAYLGRRSRSGSDVSEASGLPQKPSQPSITDRLLREGYTEAELTELAGKHVCAAGEL